MLSSSFQVCSDGAIHSAPWNTRLQQRIKTKPNPSCRNRNIKKNKLSGLIFIEMSIDTPFRLWHQRVECHIFCRWDWASARGLVANTIEECKHSEGRERPINACSLGLINYLKKETEVWGHQRNLIRTRFITPSLHPQPLPPSPPHTVVSSSALLHLLTPLCGARVQLIPWPLTGVKEMRLARITFTHDPVGRELDIWEEILHLLCSFEGRNSHRSNVVNVSLFLILRCSNS